MRVTFIQPSLGRKRAKKFGRAWAIEPLTFSILKALTPADVEISLCDDRIEDIDYSQETDLVGITVDTFTAKRSYEIARQFRNRNIPVILGGFHPTLIPEEAIEHADSIVIGQAENVWAKVIEDTRKDNLQRFYVRDGSNSTRWVAQDKSIFKEKKYFPISLTEFGRGCAYSCEFCAVHNFFSQDYLTKPVDFFIKEINDSGKKNFIFADDNIASDHKKLEEVCKQLTSLNINWVSQADISVAKDESLLKTMKNSGCQGLLIGFESLSKENLKQMGKLHNTLTGEYREAIAKLRDNGIRIYGSFINGYDHETRDSIDKSVEFALDQKLALATFYPLTPFPGTRLYERLKEEKRLIYKRWWLESNYRYGDLVFKPKDMTPEELSKKCNDASATFYNYKNIFLRGLDFKANSRNLKSAFFYITANLYTVVPSSM